MSNYYLETIAKWRSLGGIVAGKTDRKTFRLDEGKELEYKVFVVSHSLLSQIHTHIDFFFLFSLGAMIGYFF